MSKLKTIGKAIVDKAKPTAAAASDAAKVAGKLPPASRQTAVDRLFIEMEQLKSSENSLQNLAKDDIEDTYEHYVREVPPKVDVEKEVNEALLSVKADIDANRESLLYSTDVSENILYDVQTRNPEEYRRRLNEQLLDDQLSARTVRKIDPYEMDDDLEAIRERIDAGYASDKEIGYVDAIDSVRSSYNRWIRKDTNMLEKLAGTNKRYIPRLASWLGNDAVYVRKGANGKNQPWVFYHADRYTDPQRGGTGDFIQFEAPFEMGLHSGSHDAAVTAAIRDGEEGLMFRVEEMNDAIDNMIGMSQTPNVTRDMIVETMHDLLADRFKQKGKVGIQAIVDDLQKHLSNIIGDERSIALFLSDLRQFPTVNMTPHYFRGKNGLVLKDTGGWGEDEVARQLRIVYPEDTVKIDNLMSNKNRVKNLQKYIESKGFDHIVYHNTAEDVGTLSIINWNPDLYVPAYDPKLHGGSIDAAASAYAAFLLTSLGITGAAVQQDEQGET